MLIDSSPLWTGDLESESGLAEPWTKIDGRVGVITVDGMIDADAWHWLANEIQSARIDPDIDYLLITINSRSQEWLRHWEAIAALQEASREMLTACFIDCAFGLGITLALTCRFVVASRRAEIGKLTGDSSCENWPGKKSTEHTLSTPIIAGSEWRRGIPGVAVNRLVSGIIGGMEAEQIGLADLVHYMPEETTAYLKDRVKAG